MVTTGLGLVFVLIGVVLGVLDGLILGGMVGLLVGTGTIAVGFMLKDAD